MTVDSPEQAEAQELIARGFALLETLAQRRAAGVTCPAYFMHYCCCGGNFLFFYPSEAAALAPNAMEGAMKAGAYERDLRAKAEEVGARFINADDDPTPACGCGEAMDCCAIAGGQAARLIDRIGGEIEPEGTCAAIPGSVYVQTHTGAKWVKKSGTGNTGWERQED